MNIKVTIKHGAGNEFELEVSEGATLDTLLKNVTVVSVCGSHNSARVNGTVEGLESTLRSGDVVEPQTKANDKGSR